MKSEVRGSILALIPRKKKYLVKKRGISHHVQEPVKPNSLAYQVLNKHPQEGTMRAMRSFHTESSDEKSEVKLGYSSLSGVPDLLARRDKSGLVRENVVESGFISLNFE